ncbi:DUF1523 family protein [Pasteurella canis]|uniref:DUF1523 family protein n=1 Tax=Pasteurella canis TaxID=753 RepID=UPI001E3BF070|nr:DUF1523 family protein [Pasteurella canis]UEC23216.1 DUF1523 family protein [Pasteurella canis]
MRKFFKFFFLTVIFIFHLFLFVAVNFVTPSYDVTKVTGVEVKRVDKDGPITKANPADGPTRDVYFINTQHQDGKIMVYRNEDTRWGFPFYFKFGSANLHAEAEALGKENKTVQIKYYGWRLVMFDEFRNAVNIKAIDETESPSHPILAYVLYFLLLITLFFSIQFVRGWFDSEN